MKRQLNDILPEETKKILKETFKELTEDVYLELFVKEGDQFSEFTEGFLTGISKTTNKINLKIFRSNDQYAKNKAITRFPTLLLNPDKFKISIVGAPLGEEARTLIMAIVLVSVRGSILSQDAVRRLLHLKEKSVIQVFVSPTCPYCPQQALNAVSAAIARPDIISVEIIEMYENRDYIDKYHIVTVPFTAINDIPIGTGVRPGEIFVEEVINLSSFEKGFAPISGEVIETDLIIVGGGPAGLTAGIYAGRSGLKSIILERSMVGGQVLVTPIVENYPGFSQIAGKTLVDVMYQQALHYCHIIDGEDVKDVTRKGGLFELSTNRRRYKAKAIIIATGAEHKRLNCQGEENLRGRGVSYCATCDGYLYKDGKRVIVVGGGNTALTDALYLHNLGAKVSLVHRRDALRAEKYLQKSLFESNIPVYWNTVVKEILGSKHVVGVRLQNVKDNSIKLIEVDGVFIAIGYEPNNSIAKMLGLELIEEGYIKTDNRQRTSMDMVYAAGDVTGGIKQIATAVGQGAVAAISAFEDISSPYWTK